MAALQRRMERAALWFNNALPPLEHIPCYGMRLEGPETKAPAFLHTYACLYPVERRYVVFGLANSPTPPLTALEVRGRIAGCTLPPEKVQDQRHVLDRYYKDAYDPVGGWAEALGLSLVSRLPVAMFVFGHTQVSTKERLTYFRVMLTAPAEHALRAFQRAAPITLG